MEKQEFYIKRCFLIAQNAKKNASPNPTVGAVIVADDKIIGEGFTSAYGGPHAEVNAIQDTINKKLEHLLPLSTIYVSLEPCFHFGRTPPCVDLILKYKIPRVVISCKDVNPLVAGKSIEKLRHNNVDVIENVLESEGKDLIRTFSTHIIQQMPYIILKYAQSNDKYLGKIGERTPISNPYTQRLVHRWRSECDAIMVGTTTARIDNPRLDNRFFGNKQPIRVVIDKNLSLPKHLHLFDKNIRTIIFNNIKNIENQNIIKINFDNENHLSEMLSYLYTQKVGILLVEGGSKTLQSFIDAELWDEARVITATKNIGEGGVKAPNIEGTLVNKFYLDNDKIEIFQKKNYDTKVVENFGDLA